MKALDDKAAYEANRKKAEEIIGGAKDGNVRALETLRRMVKANPAGFPDEYLQDLENSTPEGKDRIQQKRFEAQRSRNLRKQDGEGQGEGRQAGRRPEPAGP